MNNQQERLRSDFRAHRYFILMCGAVALSASFCLAGDDVAWSTTISTDHNPGGEPGGATDSPLAIRSDSNGDFYVLIRSVFPALEGQGIGGATGRSYALAKVNKSGEELWRREYGEDSIHTYDLASGFGPSDRALAVDSLGRPRRAGSNWESYSPSTGHYMVATRNNWDPQTGDHLWVSTWAPGAVSNAFENGFVLDDEDNMFVIGTSQFSFCCSSSYWPYAAKVDANGKQVWLHSFELNNDRGSYRSAALTDDGNLIAFGTAINGSFRLSKYDADTGELIWTVIHELDGQSQGFNGRMVLDTTGDIIVTGPGFGDGNERFARVLKFDGTGQLLWESSYSTDVEHPDGDSQFFCTQPRVLNDGSFVLAGHFYFADTGWDIVTRRYASDGSIIWHRQYDPAAIIGVNADEEVQVMIADPNDGVVLTGRIGDENDPDGPVTGFILHYSESGELLWQHGEAHESGGDVRARGAAFAPNGDLVVGYRVNDADADAADILLVRYGSGPQVCTSDLDNSGEVDVADLLQLLSAWGACDGCAADLDNSGAVDIADLLQLLGAWGTCE